MGDVGDSVAVEVHHVTLFAEYGYFIEYGSVARFKKYLLATGTLFILAFLTLRKLTLFAEKMATRDALHGVLDQKAAVHAPVVVIKTCGGTDIVLGHFLQ